MFQINVIHCIEISRFFGCWKTTRVQMLIVIIALNLMQIWSPSPSTHGVIQEKNLANFLPPLRAHPS